MGSVNMHHSFGMQALGFDGNESVNYAINANDAYDSSQSIHTVAEYSTEASNVHTVSSNQVHNQYEPRQTVSNVSSAHWFPHEQPRHASEHYNAAYLAGADCNTQSAACFSSYEGAHFAASQQQNGNGGSGSQNTPKAPMPNAHVGKKTAPRKNTSSIHKTQSAQASRSTHTARTNKMNYANGGGLMRNFETPQNAMYNGLYAMQDANSPYDQCQPSFAAEYGGYYAVSTFNDASQPMYHTLEGQGATAEMGFEQHMQPALMCMNYDTYGAAPAAYFGGNAAAFTAENELVENVGYYALNEYGGCNAQNSNIKCGMAPETYATSHLSTKALVKERLRQKIQERMLKKFESLPPYAKKETLTPKSQRPPSAHHRTPCDSQKHRMPTPCNSETKNLATGKMFSGCADDAASAHTPNSHRSAPTSGHVTVNKGTENGAFDRPAADSERGFLQAFSGDNPGPFLCAEVGGVLQTAVYLDSIAMREVPFAYPTSWPAQDANSDAAAPATATKMASDAKLHLRPQDAAIFAMKPQCEKGPMGAAAIAKSSSFDAFKNWINFDGADVLTPARPGTTTTDQRIAQSPALKYLLGSPTLNSGEEAAAVIEKKLSVLTADCNSATQPQTTFEGYAAFADDCFARDAFFVAAAAVDDAQGAFGANSFFPSDDRHAFNAPNASKRIPKHHAK